MEALSVGRFAYGLAMIWLSLVLGANAEGAPGSILVNPAQPVNGCKTSQPAAFPKIDLDCTHQLEYVGSYSVEGQFKALSAYRSLYNQEAKQPSAFQHDGKPLTRPLEVPDFVNLAPQERVVESYAGRAHAVKPLHGQSRLAVLRDRIVTFAYGREQAIMAPQHLTIDSRGRLIIVDRIANAVHVLDGASSFRIAAGERRHLRRPSSVAVDGDDNIYVVDSSLGLVEVFDSRGTFLRNIGQIDDETLFVYPTGITIDRHHERIYLLDTPRNLMLILDLQGRILKRVGRRSNDETPVEFRYPTEIALGNGEVVVLDAAGSRIQALDLDGRPLRQFSTHTSAPQGDSVQNGMSLSVDGHGNMYLSYVRGSEISVFAPDGTLLNSFGKMGAHEALFRAPAGLWVADSRLFVADTENRRIAVFEIHSKARPDNPTLIAAAP